MIVDFGSKQMEYPTADFGELRESSSLLGRTQELHARYEQDGYLFFRNLIDPAVVQKARERVLAYMEAKKVLEDGTPALEGVMPRGGRTVNLLGTNPVTSDSSVLAALEAPELFEFFERFYGEPAVTFAYKWLRAVGNEKFTGSHFDVVYMGRGSRRVNTVWIPLGDLPIEQGTLAICEGSHRESGFKRLRETYGKLDVDRDKTEGWFSSDPIEILEKFGGRWLTTHFCPGDVLTFGLYTLHASTTNKTNRFRLSCDVRFQPSSEPLDERWDADGEKHRSFASEPSLISMTDARSRWGI